MKFENCPLEIRLNVCLVTSKASKRRKEEKKEKKKREEREIPDLVCQYVKYGNFRNIALW